MWWVLGWYNRRRGTYVGWLDGVEVNMSGTKGGVFPVGAGSTGSCIHPVQDTSWWYSTDTTPAPAILAPSSCYPLSSCSHKWIFRLTSRGPVQQMIFSSKAEDKENKSLVLFLLREAKKATFCHNHPHIAQGRCQRSNAIAGNLCYAVLFPQLFGCADHCMRLKPGREDIDPSAHKLNEFRGQVSCP